jgi:SAM-dependent methyltransferase
MTGVSLRERAIHDQTWWELLRCPVTGQPLRPGADGSLARADGKAEYPVVRGVPVLINERRSTFRTADYEEDPGFSPTLSHNGRLPELVDRRLPTLSLNLRSRDNFELLAELVRGLAPPTERPRVLIVGAGEGGAGAEPVIDDSRIASIETDVSLGPRTQVVCDAHDLPFADGVFHAVVCQAVLEHVLDPVTVVDEIHRVLAPNGLVYSEVPFMQQVHGGAYDVTRFTLVGHRRLYRFFDEVRSGVQGGPGMALSWSLWYFLRSMARTRAGRGMAFMIARVMFSWLKYFDLWLAKKPGAVDAASGTFFLGRRRDEAVSDEAILSSYQGAGSCRPR